VEWWIGVTQEAWERYMYEQSGGGT
jgi:hypothetical protein